MDLSLTAGEVRTYSDATGVGMGEAKRVLMKQKIIRALQQAETLHEMKAILHHVVKLLR
jgi:hypothetical protein